MWFNGFLWWNVFLKFRHFFLGQFRRMVWELFSFSCLFRAWERSKLKTNWLKKTWPFFINFHQFSLLRRSFNFQKHAGVNIKLISDYTKPFISLLSPFAQWQFKFFTLLFQFFSLLVSQKPICVSNFFWTSFFSSLFQFFVSKHFCDVTVLRASNWAWVIKFWYAFFSIVIWMEKNLMNFCFGKREEI